MISQKIPEKIQYPDIPRRIITKQKFGFGMPLTLSFMFGGKNMLVNKDSKALSSLDGCNGEGEDMFVLSKN